MPDIAKSDISPNLDRDKMFNELWWLNYCFCEGVGIGAVGESLLWWGGSEHLPAVQVSLGFFACPCFGAYMSVQRIISQTSDLGE